MQNIVLSPISLQDLELLITNSVISALTLASPPTTRAVEDQQFSMKELAAYLKCSMQTICVYKKRGVFKYYQTGRTIYFKKSEVDAALASDKKGLKRAA
jgi:excisionase family DNA binding protein